MLTDYSMESLYFIINSKPKYFDKKDYQDTLDIFTSLSLGYKSTSLES